MFIVTVLDQFVADSVPRTASGRRNAEQAVFGGRLIINLKIFDFVSLHFAAIFKHLQNCFSVIPHRQEYMKWLARFNYIQLPIDFTCQKIYLRNQQ